MHYAIYTCPSEWLEDSGTSGTVVLGQDDVPKTYKVGDFITAVVMVESGDIINNIEFALRYPKTLKYLKTGTDFPVLKDLLDMERTATTRRLSGKLAGQGVKDIVALRVAFRVEAPGPITIAMDRFVVECRMSGAGVTDNAV